MAIEGLDGAGKNTIMARIVDEARERGVSVSTLAFPNYQASEFADLAAEALHGEHGDIVDSPYAMAMLFALDRWNSKDDLSAALADDDLVPGDRWLWRRTPLTVPCPVG